MAALGVPADESEDESESEDEQLFEVWRENTAALAAFRVCGRLWRVGPMGGVLGLDRPSVEAELRMRKIKVNAALLDDLAAIENGVLEAWNAKR